MGQRGGIVVEAGGYERKKHANATVGGICDPMKMVENANSFTTICALRAGGKQVSYRMSINQPFCHELLV